MHTFADGNNISRGDARMQQRRKFSIRDLFRTGAEFSDARKGAEYGRTQEKCNTEGE